MTIKKTSSKLKQPAIRQIDNDCVQTKLCQWSLDTLPLDPGYHKRSFEQNREQLLLNVKAFTICAAYNGSR